MHPFKWNTIFSPSHVTLNCGTKDCCSKFFKTLRILSAYRFMMYLKICTTTFKNMYAAVVLLYEISSSMIHAK